MLTLSNTRLVLKIHPRGAEMRSLTGANREWLWQPGDIGWQSTAPLLFPIIGRLVHGGVYHNGQYWPLPAHGFLRHQHFRVMEHHPAHLHLRCTTTPDTQILWPFAWQFDVHYRLQDNRVSVNYQLFNRDDKVMWFSLGSHPGFALPIGRESGWRVRFSSPRCRGPWPTHQRTLVVNHDAPTTNAGDLLLTPTTFTQGALYFSQAEHQTIEVIAPNGVCPLQLDTGSHPWVALWSEPGSDLLCIEPLFGTTDAPDATGELQHKRGMLTLAPRNTFECRFDFTLRADETGWAG